MRNHVVVDGSNIATEGRSMPSLQQLNDAVLAFIEENPDALITVVVDATFGHRIDPRESAEFDAAVANNELVAPPAGAIGRGDAFVLSIANKVKARILTNDSYQEFHAQYPWLFDEGRLIGGKPVPHVGWVFVNRLPVRGPISRKATSEARRRKRPDAADSVAIVGSPEASQPMPVPTAPPPRATRRTAATAKAVVEPAVPEVVAPPSGSRRRGRAANAPATSVAAPVPTAPTPTPPAAEATARSSGHGHVNDLMPYLDFVARHPVGTSVSAVVDHYSSHGAYVLIGDVKAYLPLRLMADPAPRSARELLKIGETHVVVVESYVPDKRSIDLALPGMAASVVANTPAPAKKGPVAKKAETTTQTPAKKALAKVAAVSAAPAKKASAKATTAPVTAGPSTKSAAGKSASAKKVAGKEAAGKEAAAKATGVKAAAVTAVPAKRAPIEKVPSERASVKAAAAKKPAAKKLPAVTTLASKAPATTAPAKKEAAQKVPSKKMPAKKAAARKTGG